MLDDGVQAVQAVLGDGKSGVLGELKAPQSFQIPPNVRGEHSPGGGDEIRAQPGDAVAQTEVHVPQLVGVPIKEQAAVVVEHRGLFLNFQGLRVKQHAEIAHVPVRVQDQPVQNAHAAKGVPAAHVLEPAQQGGQGVLLGEQGGGLGKAMALVGEQGALADQLAPVHVQVVGYGLRAEPGGQLARQILGDWLQAEETTRFVELDAVPLPHPALGVLSVGTELRGGGGEGGAAEGPVEGGVGDDGVEWVAIEGHLVPGEGGADGLHPERVVQREGVGHVQIAVQALAAVLQQQLVHMGPVLGGPPPLQKAGEAPIAQGPQVGVPALLHRRHLVKLVPDAGKLQPGDVLVHEKIGHRIPSLCVHEQLFVVFVCSDRFYKLGLESASLLIRPIRLATDHLNVLLLFERSAGQHRSRYNADLIVWQPSK